MRLISRLLSLTILIIVFACGNKASSDHSGHTKVNEDDPNQALYNQVMDIHDEVMPFTEDLYNINKGLKAQLKEAKDDSVKADLVRRIGYIDAVNQLMMEWMRKFHPPDS